MRAIIVGALMLASGAFVAGCQREQGARQQQGAQQPGQPAAQPGAPSGTGGGGQAGTPPAPATQPGVTGTSPDTGPVQRPPGDTQGGAVVPSPTPPPDKQTDEQTSRPRSQPEALGMAALTRVRPLQEEPGTQEEPVEERQEPQEDATGGSGLVTQDDTLPHTMPEMQEDIGMPETQEGIGGSGPVTPGDEEQALPDEPQFPEEDTTIVFPPLEALKPFSEGQQGTGGSGPGATPPGGMTQQAPAARHNPVIGQVHARSQDRLVVQDVQRDVYSLTLAPDACISRDGKAISLEQLDAGDTVRARWSIQDGQRVATWVDVLRDESRQHRGTGGSGQEGTGEEEPFIEPLGNDEFQGH